MQMLLALEQWTSSAVTADCTQFESCEIDSSRWALIEDYMNRKGLSTNDLLREILECFVSAKCL